MPKRSKITTIKIPMDLSVYLEKNKLNKRESKANVLRRLLNLGGS